MAANHLFAREIKHLRDLVKVLSFVGDRNLHASGRTLDLRREVPAADARDEFIMRHRVRPEVNHDRACGRYEFDDAIDGLGL